jgi:hypothetical protein
LRREVNPVRSARLGVSEAAGCCRSGTHRFIAWELPTAILLVMNRTTAITKDATSAAAKQALSTLDQNTQGAQGIAASMPAKFGS